MSIDVFINTVIHNTMKYSGYEWQVCHSGNHFLEKPVLSLFYFACMCGTPVFRLAEAGSPLLAGPQASGILPSLLSLISI